jgi:hypothetical protein
MEPIETRQRFLANLEELGLDPNHLDPWSGWRAFKEFLKLEVWGFYDAASVQVRPEEGAGCMFFVRWTLDYCTLAEWATVVEGKPWFQALINQEPTFSDVYYDTGPE